MESRSPYLPSPQTGGYSDIQLADLSSHSLLRSTAPEIQPAKNVTVDAWPQPPQAPFGGKGSTRTASAAVISGWQQRPRLLRRHPWLTALSVTGDLILLFAWLALAAFAIGIARSIGVTKANLQFGDELLAQARIIAPTLFPILFAATVGRCTKLIAMYRAERGERLGILDQLQGSTSFAGTLITAATTRGVGFLTALLVLIWSLSPLGGQASLRSFYYQPNVTETPATFPYLSMNNSDIVPFPSSTRVVSRSAANALFSAALVSSSNVTDSPMDLWGNVKIPSVEALERTRKADQDGWYQLTDAPPTTKEYSSLIGIPIGMGEAQNGSARLSLETFYWTLQCESVTSAQQEDASPKGLLNNATGPLPFNYTASSSGIHAFTDRGTDLNRNNRTNPNDARRILFVVEDHYKFFADCNILTTYVESEVLCQKGACAVSRVRQPVQPHPSRNMTGLDSERPVPDRSNYLDNLLTAVPGRNSQPSTLSRYILGLLGVTSSTKDQDRDKPALANPGLFADLLAQALNTYWIASIGYESYVTNHDGANYTFGGRFDFSDTFVVNFQNSSASLWSEEPVFACSTGWLAVLFLAVLVPLVACVANLALACFVLRGPHLSMNFTTMVKDNPYVATPLGGSTMGDYDRSYVLRDVKVRYGDVAPAEPVGYIALGAVDAEGPLSTGGVARLDRTKTRYYE